jgi:activator of HSP90 ATPase
MAGAGSIWNTGNWHWEEKNYKQWGSTRIRELILSLSLSNSGFKITFPEITKLTGEAAVNIRKGKTILLFEFEIEGNWKAELLESQEGAEPLTGTFKIHEFNQEEMDDFTLEATAAKESEASSKIRYFLQGKARQDLTRIFQQFYNEFKELESNQKKLEEDKKRRMEEDEKRKAALVQTGDQQAKILAESRAREEAIREEALKKREAEENAGKGSVWNTGSYFWEEKSVSWAQDRLKELLTEKSVSIPEGSIKLTVTEVHGDSSVSIRKGKKIVAYCHELKIKFEAQQNELKAEGELHLPDISADSAYDIHITFTSNHQGQEVFKPFIESQVKDFIKEAIQIFVNQLNQV